jgi:hypothetical protein
MVDKLKSIGNTIGNTQQAIEFLKRRAGYLPGVDRTRGAMTAVDVEYIAPFLTNENNRKMSLTLNFFPLPPSTGVIQGAFDNSTIGLKAAVPTLPKETTPGYLLIAFIASGGNTTVFPTDITMIDYPNVAVPPPPGNYNIPPFADHAGWTVLAIATTDYSGQNIGGTCGIPYHPHGGVCTAGLLTCAAYRKVQPGEVTKNPSAFSSSANSGTSVWLYEISTTDVPLAGVTGDNNQTSSPFRALLSGSGNVLSMVHWATSAGHSATPTPLTSDAVQGTLFHASNTLNNPQVGLSQTDNWVQMIKSRTGVTEAEVTVAGAYTSLNWCGSAFIMPESYDLPDIPYPENYVIFSGGVNTNMSTTTLYASGVRVYIDGQDISQWIFGSPSGVIDEDNWHFDDIDIGIWVKSAGRHSLVVTCDEGSADVDSRFEII